VDGHPPIDRAALERFFSPDDPTGFVKYYETASLGRYRPRVTIGPTIHYATCPLPAAQFPDCVVARGDIAAFSAGMDLMRDVVKKSSEAGVDFSAFDVNGRKGTADGWADGVMLFTNVDFGGIAFPFAYFNRGDNLNGGTGGPMIVNGIKVGHIAIAGDSDMHVMVHEFGHLLGLTDLYDESGTYAGLYLSWMGAWGYDARIPLPDAETRFRLRWANWNQVQGKQRVRIHPAETSGDVYRVGAGDEYFLVENRGAGVFDQSVTTRGLAVFHVDRTVKLDGTEGTFVNRIIDCVNCDPWKPYIGLMQADGSFDIETGHAFDSKWDLFQKGSHLYPDTSLEPISATHKVLSSNFHDGSLSGFALDDVSVESNGDILVTLTGPEADQCGVSLCADGDGCKPVTCGESNAGGCTQAPGPVWLGLLALLLLEKGLRRR